MYEDGTKSFLNICILQWLHQFGNKYSIIVNANQIPIKVGLFFPPTFFFLCKMKYNFLEWKLLIYRAIRLYKKPTAIIFLFYIICSFFFFFFCAAAYSNPRGLFTPHLFRNIRKVNLNLFKKLFFSIRDIEILRTTFFNFSLFFASLLFYCYFLSSRLQLCTSSNLNENLLGKWIFLAKVRSH